MGAKSNGLASEVEGGLKMLGDTAGRDPMLAREQGFHFPLSLVVGLLGTLLMLYLTIVAVLEECEIVEYDSEMSRVEGGFGNIGTCSARWRCAK
jgi:hypothetical protein